MNRKESYHFSDKSVSRYLQTEFESHDKKALGHCSSIDLPQPKVVLKEINISRSQWQPSLTTLCKNAYTPCDNFSRDSSTISDLIQMTPIDNDNLPDQSVHEQADCV